MAMEVNALSTRQSRHGAIAVTGRAWLARALVWLGVISLALSIAGWAGRYRLNLSGSLPIGVYRVDDPSLMRGALVLACLPPAVAHMARERGYVHRGNCPGGVAPIGKFVLAITGDTVDVSDRGLAVNGRLVIGTKLLRYDSHDRPLPRARSGRYVVRDATLWLASNQSPRSFDSRYFGAVDVTAIVGQLTPAITIPDYQEPFRDAVE